MSCWLFCFSHVWREETLSVSHSWDHELPITFLVENGHQNHTRFFPLDHCLRLEVWKKPRKYFEAWKKDFYSLLQDCSKRVGLTRLRKKYSWCDKLMENMKFFNIHAAYFHFVSFNIRAWREHLNLFVASRLLPPKRGLFKVIGSLNLCDKYLKFFLLFFAVMKNREKRLG